MATKKPPSKAKKAAPKKLRKRPGKKFDDEPIIVKPGGGGLLKGSARPAATYVEIEFDTPVGFNPKHLPHSDKPRKKILRHRRAQQLQTLVLQYNDGNAPSYDITDVAEIIIYYEGSRRFRPSRKRKGGTQGKKSRASSKKRS